MAIALALLLAGLAIGAALHANARAGAWASRYHDETQRTIAHERARNARLERMFEEVDSGRLQLRSVAERDADLAEQAARGAGADVHAPGAPRLIPALQAFLEGLEDDDRQEYLETIAHELANDPNADQEALLARLSDPTF